VRKSEAAGATIEASVKKAISFAGARVKKISKIKLLREKVERETKYEKLEQLKTGIKPETIVETNYVEVPILDIQESHNPSPDMKEALSTSAPASKNQASQEISVECLTCENLVHCDLRNKPSLETEGKVQNRTPCPSAKKFI
jgi:hypothetical protein